MPQPLPPTIPESLNTSPHIHLAYSKLLQLEKAADYSHSNREVYEEKLEHARILGMMKCTSSVKCIMTITSALVSRLHSPLLPSF